MATTGVAVSEPDGAPVGNDPVGSTPGVANWNRGVAVGPGVIVANPLNWFGVGVGPGFGGFCQT